AANRAANKAANADSSMANMPGMSMPAPAAASTGLGELTSYAGAAPADGDALAAAHKPFPAALPAAPAGPLAKVNLVLKDVTIQVAPGGQYLAWASAGSGTRPVH